MTTAPCPIELVPSSRRTVEPDRAARRPRPRRDRREARASADRRALQRPVRNDAASCRASGTRSCGRFGPGQARLDRRQVEPQHLGVTSAHGRVVGAEQAAAPWRTARPARLPPRCGRSRADRRASASSTGKKPIVAPYSGAMLADRGPVGHASCVATPGPKNSTNLSTTPSLRRILRDGEHQVGGRRAGRQLAGELEADHLGQRACRAAGRA